MRIAQIDPERKALRGVEGVFAFGVQLQNWILLEPLGRELSPVSSEPVKICPTCNCEYVVSAEICADCGGLLKFPEELRADGEQETVGEIRELDPALEAEAGRLEALGILESSYSAGHPETPAAGEVSIKICPACRTEYQPSAQVCADCGVTLQFLGSMAAKSRIAGGTRAPDQSAADQLPHSSDLVCLRIAQLGWIRDLHSRLSHAGIPIRLEVEKTDGTHDIHRWFYRLWNTRHPPLVLPAVRAARGFRCGGDRRPGLRSGAHAGTG